jgi:hypothetical protein
MTRAGPCGSPLGFARRAAALAAIALCGIAGAAPPPPEAAIAPLLDGLAPAAVPAASASAAAQRYFAQGMALAWGFNPAEAARSFAAATRADPQCALCYWGLAWSLGPNINADMNAADAARVAEALARARALAPQASARDRALIEALAARHPQATAAAVDEDAYAARMSALARAYPGDAEVATWPPKR